MTVRQHASWDEEKKERNISSLECLMSIVTLLCFHWVMHCLDLYKYVYSSYSYFIKLFSANRILRFVLV